MKSPRIVSRPGIRLVVFDFDGTLSWLRHGWPAMMAGVVLDEIPLLQNETSAALLETLIDQILSLNGKPSIFQARLLCDTLSGRGGAARDPEAVNAEFSVRLDRAITERIAAVRSRAKLPDDFVIAGGRQFLAQLARRGLDLAILSTTQQDRVIEEAKLLGIADFFGQHIYGGTGDPKLFSKRAIFERLLKERGLRGDQLLAFGDGPVEIRDTKELGGTAIAVCSDEEQNGSGKIDACKRRLLTEAGAVAAIADYREAPALMDELLQS